MTSPSQLTVDSSGDVFVYNGPSFTTASLVEITPQGKLTTLISNLRQPSGLTVDSSGTVFVTESYQDQSGNLVNAVEKVNDGTLLPIATLPGPGAIGSLVASRTAVVVPEPGFAGVLVLAAATLRRRSRQTRNPEPGE